MTSCLSYMEAYMWHNSEPKTRYFRSNFCVTGENATEAKNKRCTDITELELLPSLCLLWSTSHAHSRRFVV
jgi:hypothetical protein